MKRLVMQVGRQQVLATGKSKKVLCDGRRRGGGCREDENDGRRGITYLRLASDFQH